MADLSFNDADVVAGANAVIEPTTLCETITAGMAVYENSGDNKVYKGDSTTAAKAAIAGILLNGGADGQPGFMITEGIVDYGGGVTPGEIYMASTHAAGGLSPESEMATGDYMTIIGVGISTTEVYVKLTVGGVQHP